MGAPRKSACDAEIFGFDGRGETRPDRRHFESDSQSATSFAGIPRAGIFPQRETAARLLGRDGIFSEPAPAGPGYRSRRAPTRFSTRGASLHAASDSGTV